MCPDDPDRVGDIDDSVTAGLSALPTLAEAGAPGPTEDLAPGTRVGQFTIVGRLGAGGMGEVYAARDERLGRTVALKAIRADWRQNEAVRARFIREAKLLSGLEHPNICRLYDYLESAQGDFLVLELIEGDALSRARPRSRGGRLAVAEGIGKALAAAHAAGVVHRDLKPDNVMITQSGEVKVLDFGIARPEEEAGEEEAGPEAAPGGSGATHSLLVTRKGGVVGTPMYMSPEQARGERAGPASDICSFGLLIEELFTGRPPRARAGTVDELIEQAGRGERAAARGVDGDIRRLVREMTDPDASARPAASEVLRRLARCRRRGVRRAVAAAATVVVVLAGAGAVKYTVDLRAEVDRTQRALQASDRLLMTVVDEFGDAMRDAGRLDAIEAVSARIEEHLGEREDSVLALEPNDLVRVARAVGLAGQAKLQRGERDQALASFDRALMILDRVLEDKPDNSYALTELGVAQFNLGSVAWGDGNYPLVVKWFEEYLGTARRLEELNPDDPDAAFEVAQALTNLYAVYDRIGEDDRAFAAVEQSIAIKRELVASKGQTRDENWRLWSESLANGLSYLAEAFDARGDLAGAVGAAEEETAVLAPVLEEFPGMASVRFIQSTALNVHANLLSRAGRHTEALERLREMRDVTEQLLQIDETSTRAVRERAIACQMIARECMALGELDEAEEALEESRTRLTALLEADPTQVRWDLDMIDAVLGLATIGLERGDLAAVAAAAGRLRDRLDALSERGRGIQDFELRMARLETLEGRLAAARGEGAAAQERWESALSRIEGLGEVSGDVLLAEPAATVLLYLGRDGEARPLVEWLRGQGRQTVALERLAAERGF